MLPRKSHGGTPLRNVRGIVVAPRERFISQPFRRTRPARSRSPLLSQQPGGSLFAALRLPILYAAPHFKDEFARNFFSSSFSSSSSFSFFFYFFFFFHEHSRVSPSHHRPDAERNCGERSGFALSRLNFIPRRCILLMQRRNCFVRLSHRVAF